MVASPRLQNSFANGSKRVSPIRPKRRIFWETALDGVVAEKVLTGDEDSATALLQQMLAVKTMSSVARCTWLAQVLATQICSPSRAALDAES